MPTNHAHYFLKALFCPYTDERLRLEIRCLRPPGAPHWQRDAQSDWWPLTPGGIAAAAKTALVWSPRWNVYCGVLPRLGRRRFVADVVSARWIWCEIDGKEEGMPGAHALLQNALSNGLPAPHMIVESGGGIHNYWRLSEPVSVTTSEERASFSSLLRRLVHTVGGVEWEKRSNYYTGKLKAEDPNAVHADPVCCDMARILRIPDTFNHKRERQRPVVLAQIAPELPRFPLDWWRAYLPPQPVSAPPQRHHNPAPGQVQQLPPLTVQKLNTYWPLGQRHEAFREIMASARLCGFGLNTLEMIAEELIAKNQADRRHVMGLVQDTMRRIQPTYN